MTQVDPFVAIGMVLRNFLAEMGRPDPAADAARRAALSDISDATDLWWLLYGSPQLAPGP